MKKTKAFNIENGFYYYSSFYQSRNRNSQIRKFYSKNKPIKELGLFEARLILRFIHFSFPINYYFFQERNKNLYVTYIRFYFKIKINFLLKIFNPRWDLSGRNRLRSTKYEDYMAEDLERDRRMAFSNNIFSKSPSGSPCSDYA